MGRFGTPDEIAPAVLFLASSAFVLTAIPWYVLVGLETHGEFLSGFLWTHNLERGLATMESHDGFPGYYLVILLVGSMSAFYSLGNHLNEHQYDRVYVHSGRVSETRALLRVCQARRPRCEDCVLNDFCPSSQV